MTRLESFSDVLLAVYRASRELPMYEFQDAPKRVEAYEEVKKKILRSPYSPKQ